MLEIADELEKVLQSGERVALATVVATSGSTPRTVGTRMAIRAGGRHLGTVGGGCGEAEVIKAGLTALDDGRARRVRADLTDEATEESESACGGVMDVLVAPFGAELLPVVRAVQEAHRGRRRAVVAMIVGPEEGDVGPTSGGMAVAAVEKAIEEAGGTRVPTAWAGPGMDSAADAALLVDAAYRACRRERRAGETETVRQERAQVPGGAAGELLAEVIQVPPALVVCGGGHIALPLSQMAKTLGYAVTVIDDRPSFADRARFPHVDRVVCRPYARALAETPLDDSTAVVVVTRGHKHDIECVRAVLGRGAAYVGMIGSRRRVAGARELLGRDGFPEEEVARLHAPIGLDIGAETPAEIALAILAEITLERRGGTAAPMSRRLAGGGRP